MNKKTCSECRWFEPHDKPLVLFTEQYTHEPVMACGPGETTGDCKGGLPTIYVAFYSDPNRNETLWGRWPIVRSTTGICGHFWVWEEVEE